MKKKPTSKPKSKAKRKTALPVPSTAHIRDAWFALGFVSCLGLVIMVWIWLARMFN